MNPPESAWEADAIPLGDTCLFSFLSRSDGSTVFHGGVCTNPPESAWEADAIRAQATPAYLVLFYNTSIIYHTIYKKKSIINLLFIVFDFSAPTLCHGYQFFARKYIDDYQNNDIYAVNKRLPRWGYGIPEKF